MLTITICDRFIDFKGIADRLKSPEIVRVLSNPMSYTPADATNTAKTIQLPDGRRLGYAEYGNPNGKHIMFFHGHPGSRLEAQYLDETAVRLGARIVALERPGFGLSDFKPRRTVLDWTQDVLALADQLNLARFAVMGVSGGGPCSRNQLEQNTKANGIEVMALHNHMLNESPRAL